ncbi:MAG TPA: cyclase [Dehalococcoidia bacterium]|nr:cyclase [Dehalococcoidia bacterium]
MATMFVRHQVADFAKWKQAYDAFNPRRSELGVKAHAIYRAADDPNDVTVTHEFAALEAAKSFASSEDLHGAMGRAGVVGEPTIWFATRS